MIPGDGIGPELMNAVKVGVESKPKKYDHAVSPFVPKAQKICWQDFYEKLKNRTMLALS